MTELHAVSSDLSSLPRPLLLAVAHRQLLRDVLSDTAATTVCAVAAVVRVQQEVDYLWRDSLALHDRALTERLAEAGHGLRRVARLLDQDSTIS